MVARFPNVAERGFWEYSAYVGKKVWALADGRILTGPFSGVRLSRETKWSGSVDIASKLFGLYEQQIQFWLTKNQWSAFVNIGASDGYYAVAMKQTGFALESYAFEQNISAHSEIQNLAQLNSTTLDGVFGVFESREVDWIQELSRTKPDVLVLLDIEGGEWDLLNKSNLEKLSMCHLIIEIHEFSENSRSLDALVKLIETTHVVSIQDDAQRVWPSHELISKLTNAERLVIAFEGRPSLMRWLYAFPKSTH